MSNKIRGYIALAVGFIVFNTIAFVIPVEHNDTFWIAYAFTDAAFLAQIVIWKWAFSKAETLKSKFLGISIVYIGTIYLVLQIVAFVICIAIPAKGWVTAILGILILGISLLMMISGETARDEISRVEEKVSDNTAFMKRIKSELEVFAMAETNTEIKNKIDDLIQNIKYSDPVSCSATNAVEEEINSLFFTMKNGKLSADDLDELKLLIKKRSILLISGKQ